MFTKLFLTLIFLVSTNIYAEITLEEINEKPQSRAKNFMIWQYFNQDITPEQADKAFVQLDGVSNKLFFAYAKKTNDKEIKKIVSCMKERKILNIKDKGCLKLAMSPYKTLALTNKQREDLAKRVDSKYIKELLEIQSAPFSQELYATYDPSVVLTMFVSTTASHRRNNLNKFLHKKLLDHLSSSWKISQLIKIVLNDDKLDNLQKSMLKLDGENLNSLDNFYLALNHIKHSSKNGALKHLNLSLSKAKKMIDVDKNYFWMYKITKDQKYLGKLLLSDDINVYSLFAHETLNKNIENYFSAVETDDNLNHKSLEDPFNWNDILKEIRSTPKDNLFDLASSYKQENMIPVQSYILQKAYGFKMHGYIMPYNKYLGDISNDEKALVYAIMRQESNLIPSALSRSYALGLMQLMPFVVDDLSKREKQPINEYSEMFIPENNINYALKHIEWMKKSLYHPLFMAYAYNGGMGFFRRHLEKGTFNHGEYEPFLSMEMMSNVESREYGKRVLANYVMYKKVMGEKISIVHLFDTLTQPKKTDRFREQG